MSTTPSPVSTTELQPNNLLAEAQANVLAAVQKQIVDWNNVLKSNYLTAFNNWLINYQAGRTTVDTAPLPPKGYTLGYFTDPTSGPGSLGPYGETPVEWPYPAAGKDPVCPMPAIPPMPGTHAFPAGTALIGVRIYGPFFQALTGDTMPTIPPTDPEMPAYSAPFPATSQDGVAGIFRKYVHGMMYGYELMAPIS